MNGDPHSATRGTEVFVRANSNGNVNRDEDVQLANRVLPAVVAAITNGSSRGVKDDTQTQPGSLAVLSDPAQGNTATEHPVRSCLAEIEFITNPNVDQLLNGANKEANRNQIAAAIADALISDLESRTS
jgi:N-acetylmuramoyl-L-alanine amidase